MPNSFCQENVISRAAEAKTEKIKILYT